MFYPFFMFFCHLGFPKRSNQSSHLYIFVQFIHLTLLSSKLWETSGSSSSLPLTMIHFDTNTTIKDILAIHNLGIPFDKFIAKVSAAA
jgi:hypothetical protein